MDMINDRNTGGLVIMGHFKKEAWLNLLLPILPFIIAIVLVLILMYLKR